MKIGFLSDAHGNLLCFKKCIDYLINLGVQKIFFLGDAIGYYPDGIEILNYLKKNNIHSLMGNHEAMLIGRLKYEREKEKFYKLDQVKNNISNEQIQYIKKLKPNFEFEIDQIKIKLMHGGPADYLNQYVYRNSDLNLFNKLDYDMFFMGHTHYPFIKKINNKVIVNIGSCGMPRDFGLLSSISTLDTITKKIDIVRIPINKDKIIQKYSFCTNPSVIKLLDRKQ